MATVMDDREKAFENKFKHDEELKFKINAKAVRLFGLWAAQQLGLAETEAESYTESVIDEDFSHPGIKDILRKVQKDFLDKGIDMTEHHLENEFNEHLDRARVAVMG